MQSRTGKLAGELRAREQQIGEYVSDVDARGQDVPQTRALRERHDFVVQTQPQLNETRKISSARGLDKTFAKQRLSISK